MELFDTHLHLSQEQDNHEIVRRAQEAGVRFLLVCAGCYEDSLSAASDVYKRQLPIPASVRSAKSE